VPPPALQCGNEVVYIASDSHGLRRLHAGALVAVAV